MDKAKIKHNTEQLILEAARKVFIKKGLEGARMQEIADEAGINKALLHYYFRSKEKLFNHIFETAINGIFDDVNESIHEEGDVFVFIETFVDNYLTILQKNPFIPNFIFNEINSHPERINQFSNKIKLNIPGFKHMVEKNIAQKKISAVSPEHLLIDMLGMCVFPYVGRPLLEKVFFDDHPAGAENFLYERKQHIISFLKIALHP
jgi:AcrR family transcriptional regulator